MLENNLVYITIQTSQIYTLVILTTTHELEPDAEFTYWH